MTSLLEENNHNNIKTALPGTSVGLPKCECCLICCKNVKRKTYGNNMGCERRGKKDQVLWCEFG